MKIILKKLTLRNFMGAKEQTIDFSEDASIFGCNASGKTRLFSAFLWCLFGKNADDFKDFNIMSLDSTGEPLHRADHSVGATLLIDNMEMKLERIYREKWVKKRGEEEETFDGHETLYKVNNVPHKQGEYQKKIDDIIAEDIFKLLTNPFYFNSTMKWNVRREILSKIAGEITDEEIKAILPVELINSLNGKTLEEFRKEISEKIKLLKKVKADIPARLDEVNRSMQEDPDYPEVEKQIGELNNQVQEIDAQIASAAETYAKKNKKNQERQNKIFETKQEIQTLEFNGRNNTEKAINEIKLQRNDLLRRIEYYGQNIESFKVLIRTGENAIKSLKEKNDDLRKKWERINEEQLIFKEEEFVCPTCKRPFEGDDIETQKKELTANFNKKKAADLREINETGKGNKAEIERLEAHVKSLYNEIEGATSGITSCQGDVDKIIEPKNPATNPQILILQGQIDEIEKAIQPLEEADNSDLISRKTGLLSQLDELKKQLNIRETNEKLRIRQDELNDQRKNLTQQIADLEKKEFQCERFIRDKISLIEERVNEMFSYVRFKMFDRQVNGGLEETCQAMINGVPFQDANNGAKINAGIDIINTFSKHYDVFAPIFCDNAEAVNELLKTESQLIKLFVIPEVPKEKDKRDKYIEEYSQRGILLM